MGNDEKKRRSLGSFLNPHLGGMTEAIRQFMRRQKKMKIRHGSKRKVVHRNNQGTGALSGLRMMRSTKIGDVSEATQSGHIQPITRMFRRSSTKDEEQSISRTENAMKSMENCTAEEIDEFRQIFSMFDADGSGAVGNEELKQAMTTMGIDANDQEIDKIITEVDADGNGEIDFSEFCACMKKSQLLAKTSNEELIRQCFEVFDLDRNGLISESEFKAVAKQIGDFDDNLADVVFSELDVCSNGNLTMEQFAAGVQEYLFGGNDESEPRDPL